MSKTYKLGRSKEERNKVFQEIVDYYENNNVSLQNIADKYGVSKQAISGFLLRKGYCPRKEIKEVNKRLKVLAKGTLLEEKVKELYHRQRTLESEVRMYRMKHRNIRSSLQSIKDIYENYKADQDLFSFINILECTFKFLKEEKIVK